MAKRISVGADHAGLRYKNRIRELLEQRGYQVRDHGTHSDESVDYPDYGVAVGRDIAEGDADLGVVVCGSGIGISISANKVGGVRAANCLTAEMARLARQHNDANVLAIGERLVAEEELEAILEAFLETEASPEDRHRRRVERIHTLTGC